MYASTIIVRRLLVLPAQLIGVTLILFLLTHLIPANPVLSNLGQRAASDPQVVAAYRHQWGLDRPLYEQYGIYLWRLAHGNMGQSVTTQQSVGLDLRQRLPATAELAVAAMLIAVLVAIPLGIVSAVFRGRALDELSRLVSLLGVSMPVFWLGLVGIVIFYSKLGWAPPPGQLSATLQPPPTVTGSIVIDGILANRINVVTNALAHLVLPAVALSAYSVGLITRIMRGGMLDVLHADFIRTARAKGLTERRVIFGHAAKNALVPVVTVIGLNFGALLSGAVVIETVFSWPGIGSYAFQAATGQDLPAIMGVGLVVATLYILVNLIVDVAYVFIDPRVRVGG